jgi:hypothetical protein
MRRDMRQYGRGGRGMFDASITVSFLVVPDQVVLGFDPA